MEYEVVIGLEVHVELSTKTKIFCGCATEFGGKPNSHVCPVCLGLPGALPKLNKKVIEQAIKAGLALNCSINKYGRMDRKNYFYPDSPKNYQITQDELPICKNGYVEIELEDKTKKKIRIERIHLEEDAGKLIHSSEGTLIDLNRAGVPLAEIVSKPDLRSPKEAVAYLELLKSILTSIKVSDCKMEEGSLRCDANISVRKKDSNKYGVKTEIKNMNSFKALEKALNYETKRQIETIENGQNVTQDTRRWDDEKGVTTVMRSKESANDYRYFPEGDLITLNIDDELIKKIEKTIPELPKEKKERFLKEFDIPEYDISFITSTIEMADFFEKSAKLSGDAKAASNWLMGDISKMMKEKNMLIQELKFTPENLVELIKLINQGVISNSIGKKVLTMMFETGKTPKIIVEEQGIAQNSDEKLIMEVVKKVLDANPKSIEDFKNGKTKALGFIVGMVMKETKGKANPQIVNKLANEELKNR